MSPPPELTVAIPTYQGARHLAEALRSVVAQADAAPFDLLVCDDRSDDDTLAIVRAEAGDRARVVVNPERLGLARNWNACLERATTPLVAVFHQDDVLRPGHLAAHLAAFLAHPELGMVCGAVEIVDEHSQPVPPTVIERPDLGTADRIYPPGGFRAELAASNPVRCSAVTLRKAAILGVGGFDPAYRYAVDWEAWARLSAAWAVAWLARPTVAVRWHTGSETHRFKRGTADLEEVERVQAALFAASGPAWPDRPRRHREARHRLARAYLNRAHDARQAGDASLARRCLATALRRHPALALTALAHALGLP